MTREVSGSASPIDGALAEYFKGPNAEQKAQGLIGVYNGFTGYRRAELVNGMLGVYLEGNCQPNGTSYSIAQPLIDTLKQFPGVTYVKIYDEYDHTRDPLGNTNSWPVCLDVVFTSTWTPRPTMTSTATPTRDSRPTRVPRPRHRAPTTSDGAAPTQRRPTPRRHHRNGDFHDQSLHRRGRPTASTTAVGDRTAATATMTSTVATTATRRGDPRQPASPAPSILDSIFTFFRQLFGGK